MTERQEPIELVLGVDLGLASCGLSYVALGTRKVINPRTFRTLKSAPLGERLRLVHREIARAIRVPGVVAVGYESPFQTGKVKSAQGKANGNPLILSRIQGYVESLGWSGLYGVYELEPGDVKVAVVPGTRRANKDQVRRAVLAIAGVKLDEHAADATGAAFATARRYAMDRSRRKGIT